MAALLFAGAAAQTDDQLALTALYEAANGASWHDNAGWLAGVPCANDEPTPVTCVRTTDSETGGLNADGCLQSAFVEKTQSDRPFKRALSGRLAWAGTTCCSPPTTPKCAKPDRSLNEKPCSSDPCNTDRVRSLSLGYAGLTGTLPTEIGLLDGVVNFMMLSGNSLSGTLPTQIGLLSNLGSCVEPCGRFLWLDANQISGTLPSQLGLLTNLAGTLDVSGNRLSGTVPTELAALEKLQGRLHLHGNALNTQASADGGCAGKLPETCEVV